MNSTTKSTDSLRQSAEALERNLKEGITSFDTLQRTTNRLKRVKRELERRLRPIAAAAPAEAAAAEQCHMVQGEQRYENLYYKEYADPYYSALAEIKRQAKLRMRRQYLRTPQGRAEMDEKRKSADEKKARAAAEKEWKDSLLTRKQLIGFGADPKRVKRLTNPDRVKKNGSASYGVTHYFNPSRMDVYTLLPDRSTIHDIIGYDS